MSWCGALHRLRLRVSHRLFVHATDGTWIERDCSATLVGVCGTAANIATVSVSLPANAGVASPPTPALGPVSAAYAPPVPTVALAPGQESPSSSPTVFFDVQFATSVSGLTAGDFVTHSGPLQSYADSLSGSGASYTLAVVVVDRCSWQCPPGYTSSATAPGTDVFCTKKLAPATWTRANDACAPFTLASATSIVQLGALAAQAGGEETWCGAPALHLRSLDLVDIV